MPRHVVLTEAAYRKLNRELKELRLSQKNRQRTNVPKGPQRHQGGRHRAVKWYLGKASGAISKAANGTVTVYRYGGETPGTETSAGYTITAYNRMSLIADTYWVWVKEEAGRREIVSWECAT